MNHPKHDSVPVQTPVLALYQLPECTVQVHRVRKGHVLAGVPGKTAGWYRIETPYIRSYKGRIRGFWYGKDFIPFCDMQRFREYA